jgi:hypothetical protein
LLDCHRVSYCWIANNIVTAIILQYFSYCAQVWLFGMLKINIVLSIRTLAEVRRCAAKAEFAAARVQWTCCSGIFGVFPTLRYGITVRYTIGTTVSRPIATIATATTTSPITARIVSIAFVFIASMQCGIWLLRVRGIIQRSPL